MLLGLSPLLTAELLTHLDHMGHSDAIVIADANFPAYRVGARIVELPGASAPEALAAVLAVTPVDPELPVQLMSRGPGLEPAEVQRELVAAVTNSAASSHEPEYVERFEFYDLAAQAFVVVRTGECRPYGNAIVRKGVVPAPGH